MSAVAATLGVLGATAGIALISAAALSACGGDPGTGIDQPDTAKPDLVDEDDTGPGDTASDTEPVDTYVPPPDRDHDGVLDVTDVCPDGESAWTSSAATDHDGDGCRDATEDQDDDNDGRMDATDACPVGAPNGADFDLDGCFDHEDDSDADGVFDDLDGCRESASGWVTNYDIDIDRDGCLDADEDLDDDGDGIPDAEDPSPTFWDPWNHLGGAPGGEMADGGGSFILPERIVLFEEAEIRQLEPVVSSLFGTWRIHCIFIDGWYSEFNGSHDSCGSKTPAPNGTLRKTFNSAGLHYLFSRTVESEDAPPVWAVTTVDVVPPDDVIYVQAQLINASGRPCSEISGLPHNVDDAYYSPEVIIAKPEGMLQDFDGDGALDPWNIKASMCGTDNCPDGSGLCHSSVACSTMVWGATPEDVPMYVKETGNATFALMAPLPLGVDTVRIAVRSNYPLICQDIRVRVWAFGALVEDRTTPYSGRLWDVGEVNLHDGTFVRAGICEDSTPKVFCHSDAECGDAKCGPVLVCCGKERPMEIFYDP